MAVMGPRAYLMMRPLGPVPATLATACVCVRVRSRVYGSGYVGLRTAQNQATLAAMTPTIYSVIVGDLAGGRARQKAFACSPHICTHPVNAGMHINAHASGKQTRGCWSRIRRRGRGFGCCRGSFLCGWRSRWRVCLRFCFWPRVVRECCDVVLVLYRNGYDGADLGSNRTNKIVVYNTFIYFALIINGSVADLDAFGSALKHDFGDVALVR